MNKYKKGSNGQAVRRPCPQQESDNSGDNCDLVHGDVGDSEGYNVVRSTFMGETYVVRGC